MDDVGCETWPTVREGPSEHNRLEQRVFGTLLFESVQVGAGVLDSVEKALPLVVCDQVAKVRPQRR